jgi:hypothetical protein
MENEIWDARMIQVGQQQVNCGARAWEILAEPMTIHYAAVNRMVRGTRWVTTC